MQSTPTRPWVKPILVGALLFSLAAALAIRAADHADSPDTSQGNLDINDLYAFVDGDNVVFAMTVTPLLTPGEMTENAALNPSGIYEFNLDLERDGARDAVIQVIPRGSGPDQKISVIGPSVVGGGLSAAGIVSADRMTGMFGESFNKDGITAFAGPRDDPFFINLLGDESLTSVLNAVYGQALGMQIGDEDEQTLAFEDPGMDDLAGLNTVAIVVSVPKSRIASALGTSTDGTFYAWATTGERQ